LGIACPIFFSHLPCSRTSHCPVRNILKKKRFVYIWAKYSLEEKQDEQKREEFRKKFAGGATRVGKSPV
jgi:hypothetical protein